MHPRQRFKSGKGKGTLRGKLVGPDGGTIGAGAKQGRRREQTYGSKSTRQKNHSQSGDGLHSHAVFLGIESDALRVVGDGDVGAGVELGDQVLNLFPSLQSVINGGDGKRRTGGNEDEK